MEKTKEQLKKEMLKKVDKRKCKKVYAMCLQMKQSTLVGFDKLLDEWAEAKLPLYKLMGEQLKVCKTIDIDFTKDKKDDPVFSEQFFELSRELQDRVRKEISDYVAININNDIYWSDLQKIYPNINAHCLSGGLMRNIMIDNHGSSNIKFSKIMHEIYGNEKLDTIVSEVMQKY